MQSSVHVKPLRLGEPPDAGQDGASELHVEHISGTQRRDYSRLGWGKEGIQEI